MILFIRISSHFPLQSRRKADDCDEYVYRNFGISLVRASYIPKCSFPWTPLSPQMSIYVYTYGVPNTYYRPTYRKIPSVR